MGNRILSGFGNFGAAFPGAGDLMKTEPSGPAADKQQQQQQSSSPPPPSSQHHMRTPPLWDLHYDRQSAQIKSVAAADDHLNQLNSGCAPQSPPQSSPISSHANHISQNRTEGLAT